METFSFAEGRATFAALLDCVVADRMSAAITRKRGEQHTLIPL